jgi:hypothetical protein
MSSEESESKDCRECKQEEIPLQAWVVPRLIEGRLLPTKENVLESRLLPTEENVFVCGTIALMPFWENPK